MATDRPPRHYTRGAPFPDEVRLCPIGVVRSPHEERHGTPRQASVAADPGARGEESARVELLPEVPVEALRDLECFDYVWILAWLHLNDRGWNAGVVPPRGPRVRRGLFATRAPHRPNPLGLSAARLRGVEGRAVHLERVDLLDGTPVLDLKPYVPAFDAFPDARAGWVDALEEPREP